MPGDLGDILKRIERRLKAVGMSERTACKAAGVSPDLIRSMRKQFTRGTQHSASDKSLHALSVPLRTTYRYLADGVGPESTDGANNNGAHSPATFARGSAQGGGIELRAVAAPGVWMANPSEPSPPSIPIPADPRFPPSDQYAVRVQGEALNRVARDGAFLIAVQRGKNHAQPQSGEIVIVTTSVATPGIGKLREVTARRYVKTNDEVELRFDSSDPKYSDPNHPDYVPPLKLHGTKGAEVEINGVVISAFRPLG